MVEHECPQCGLILHSNPPDPARENADLRAALDRVRETCDALAELGPGTAGLMAANFVRAAIDGNPTDPA